MMSLKKKRKNITIKIYSIQYSILKKKIIYMSNDVKFFETPYIVVM